MEVIDSLEHRNLAAVPGDRQLLYTVATRPCHWINIVRILTYVSNATDNWNPRNALMRCMTLEELTKTPVKHLKLSRLQINKDNNFVKFRFITLD